MIESENPCIGCGLKYKTYPSRSKSQRFCSTPCYNKNQQKRRGRHHQPVFVGERYNNFLIKEANSTYSVCICDCGTEKIVQNSLMTKGLIKSCGCHNRLKSRKDGNFTAWGQWFRYLKDAAKKRNIIFALTLENVKELCIQDCNYCGVKPSLWEGSKKNYLASCKNKRTKDPDIKFAETKILYLNGIDRIDSSMGYKKFNVRPCCSHCNTAKLDYSDKEFKEWLKKCYNNIFGENNGNKS